MTVRPVRLAHLFAIGFIVISFPTSGLAGNRPRSDPEERYVALRMAKLPKGLKLTASQRVQLKAAFLVRARQEDHIVKTIPGWFRRRAALAPVANQLIAQEKKILSPGQFRMLSHRDPMR